MKKYLLGIVAVVLAIGFTAFTPTQGKSGGSNMQDFTWHKYNAAGDAELDPVVSFTGTDAGARTEFGCPSGGAVICARAYNALGNPLSTYIMKPAP